jgi:hypothetical protein
MTQTRVHTSDIAVNMGCLVPCGPWWRRSFIMRGSRERTVPFGIMPLRDRRTSRRIPRCHKAHQARKEHEAFFTADFGRWHWHLRELCGLGVLCVELAAQCARARPIHSAPGQTPRFQRLGTPSLNGSHSARRPTENKSIVVLLKTRQAVPAFNREPSVVDFRLSPSRAIWTRSKKEPRPPTNADERG